MDEARGGTGARLAGWLRREGVVAAWSLGLGLLLLGPALGIGYVLSYDLVAVPRQDLLPAFLGVGSGLPRAVPQDAVVAILDSILPGSDPGMLVQKALLIAVPLLAGWGAARLLGGFAGGSPLPVRLTAATLAVWNPFVVERLVLGHVTYLLAYALLPWAIAQAVQVRSGRPGSAMRLVLLLAVAALTPGGGLLVAAVAVPIAVVPGKRPMGRGRRTVIGVLVGAVIVNLPWLVPALIHPASGTSPAGSEVFGLRAEGPWGSLLTALTGGGVWNADVVPASRGWWSAPILAVALMALAVVGWPVLRDRLGRAATGWWTLMGLLGITAAMASAVLPEAWAWIVEEVPGAGLLRDAQRLLAPYVLGVAVLAALGVARLLTRLRDPATRATVWTAAILVPLAALPDAAWGVAGRLEAVAYPAGWAQVRSELHSPTAQDAPGDVIVLPWSAFRRFEWNGDRTVLDPAPRWLPRPSIAADSLAVATPTGVVEVAGDDPRAAQVAAALASGRPLADVARDIGAGWALVEEGQSPSLPADALAGWVRQLSTAELTLWRLPEPGPPPGTPAGLGVVILVDVAVGGVVLALVGLLIGRGVRGGIRRRRAGSAASDPTGAGPLVP